MSSDPNNTNHEDQTDMLPDDQNSAPEVAEETAAEEQAAASGGRGGARQFAPLPACRTATKCSSPCTPSAPISNTPSPWSKAARCRKCATDKSRCSAASSTRCAQMGLTHGNKHVKSARVVGDVLGKYHPHGDSSAYEAMVRLAQDFSMRYPLVDGQGNFGSRDGDNAAAMRYTEARLTPLADLLLSELDMGTVDFMPNYDGAFQEPAMLPARLPMVLLNGASGIAVGMATEIPSHNLREVGEPQCTGAEPRPQRQAARFHQGPDFPGGGQIISSHATSATAT